MGKQFRYLKNEVCNFHCIQMTFLHKTFCFADDLSSFPWRLAAMAMWLTLNILIPEFLRRWYLALVIGTIWLSEQSPAGNRHPQGW